MYTLGNARNLTRVNKMLLKYPVSVTEPPLKKKTPNYNYTEIPEMSRHN